MWLLFGVNITERVSEREVRERVWTMEREWDCECGECYGVYYVRDGCRKRGRVSSLKEKWSKHSRECDYSRSRWRVLEWKWYKHLLSSRTHQPSVFRRISTSYKYIFFLLFIFQNAEHSRPLTIIPGSYYCYIYNT